MENSQKKKEQVKESRYLFHRGESLIIFLLFLFQLCTRRDGEVDINFAIGVEFVVLSLLHHVRHGSSSMLRLKKRI